MNQKNLELKVLRLLSTGNSDRYPGSRHILRLWDDFEHEGSNGIQTCLFFDALGPSVKAMAEKFSDGRLLGIVAREISRQALLGLDYLYQQGVTHGG